MNSAPASERDKKTNKNIQTPYFCTYSQRALSISPNYMVVELVVPIKKGANHFSMQFIVFPLGGKMLIFGYWVKTGNKKSDLRKNLIFLKLWFYNPAYLSQHVQALNKGVNDVKFRCLCLV